MQPRLPPPAPQRGWRIVDPVVRLRALETDELYPLPDPRGAPRERGAPLLGAHASLAWDGERWWLREQGGGGLWIDGVHRRTAALVPGLELRLGGLTLLAESAELLALRALVARLIGWSGEQRREVDRALCGLRDAALGR